MRKKLISVFLMITMLLSLGSISIFASPRDHVNESASIEKSHNDYSDRIPVTKSGLCKFVLLVLACVGGYYAYNDAYKYVCDAYNCIYNKGYATGYNKAHSEVIKNYLANCKIHEEVLSHMKRAVSECTLGDIASGTIKGVKYGFSGVKYGSSAIMKLAKKVATSVRGDNLVEGIADTLVEIS